MIQRRCFLPLSYTDKKIIDQKYPEAQVLSDAEDPGMVSFQNRVVRGKSRNADK